MTTTTFTAPLLVDDQSQGSRLGWAVADIITMAKRNILAVLRTPEALFFTTLQPIMFVLLFTYVFGGAIHVPGGHYIDFLMPGIFVQTVIFGAMSSAAGLAEDLHKGIIERFRALPMSRSAVLAGRTTSDLVRNVFVVILITLVGYAVGFRIGTNFGLFLCGVLVILFFAYALSWGFAYIGLSAPNAETAQVMVFPLIFPLLFASSAFVPVATMPGWLQAFAEHQPVTQVVNASRSLMVGGVAARLGRRLVRPVVDRRPAGGPGADRRAQVPQGGLRPLYSSPVRRRSSPSSSAMGTRTWSVVSRSRTVTALSSSESKSTVTHHGVPDLVLAPVALADALGHVVVAHEVRLQGLEHLAGQRLERVLLRQRQHGHLVGRQAPVQAQHGARLSPDLVLVVGGEEEGHHRPRGAGGRLDHVRACSARWSGGRSSRASRPRRRRGP